MKLEWDKTAERFIEMGVSKGVLYPYDKATSKYAKGVAWNGLTNVTESPDGAEPNDFWADNMKYATIRSAESFGGSIEAYQAPDEWAPCDGSAELTKGVYIGQQKRTPFCFCYRTEIANDVSDDVGYKLHIIYNATASPSERAYDTINDSPDAAQLSWDFDTTPITVEGYKPTSCLTLDSREVTAEKMTVIENKLYGTDETEPEILMPLEIVELLSA